MKVIAFTSLVSLPVLTIGNGLTVQNTVVPGRTSIVCVFFKSNNLNMLHSSVCVGNIIVPSLKGT